MKIFHTAFAMTFVALVLAGCSKDDSSNPFDGVVIKLETNEKGEVDLRPDGAVVSAEGVEFIEKMALFSNDVVFADDATNISMVVKYGDGETDYRVLAINKQIKLRELELEFNGTPDEFSLIQKAEAVAFFILIRREKHAGKTKDNKVCNKEYHHHIAYTSQRIRKPIRYLVLMGNTQVLLNLPICT